MKSAKLVNDKKPGKTLTIVILSYNVRMLLADCLNSLYADPESKGWEIVVVDNDSQDDSVKYVEKHYPKVKLIRSDRNLGFSAGNNLAVDEIKTPFTLFLNPDTVVPEGTIPEMLTFMKKNSDVGAATCKVLLPSGKLDDGCHRGFPTPWNAICHFGYLEKLFPTSALFTGYNLAYKGWDTIHEIDSLTGAFMLMPTSVGKQLNWWDEDYFWNGEDLDFCFRIKEAGYKVMYVPTVTMTHFKGSSGGYKSTSHGAKTANTNTKMLAAKSSTQAMRIFYGKHYQDQYPGWLSGLVLVGINLLEAYRLQKVRK